MLRSATDMDSPKSDVIKADSPESTRALADFCSRLRDGRQGNTSNLRYWDTFLEVCIATEIPALEIHLGLNDQGGQQRSSLLLRVEKDLVSNDLVLMSQACDQEGPCSFIAGRDEGCPAIKVKLPYAKTSLVDIQLSREGNYYYIYLLVVDRNQPIEACSPVAVRFQLGDQGCYQLGESSHSPQGVPVAQFLNPSPKDPKLLAADFSTGAVLAWPVSLALLLSGCALVGWICALGGQSREGAGASMFALMLLVGTLPFYTRRVGGYTLFGLLIVTAIGVVISMTSFLFKVNVLVFALLAMGALLSLAFRKNAYGLAKAAEINLEKSQPTASKFLATRTEQEQNLLWIADFAIVLLTVVLLAWSYSSIQSWMN